MQAILIQPGKAHAGGCPVVFGIDRDVVSLSGHLACQIEMDGAPYAGRDQADLHASMSTLNLSIQIASTSSGHNRWLWEPLPDKCSST